MLFGLDRYHSFIFFLPLRPSLLSSPVACLCLSVCICLVCLLCLSRSLGIRPRSCRSDNALLILCWCALVLFLSHFIFPFGLTFMSFSFLFVLLVFARLFFFFGKYFYLAQKKWDLSFFFPSRFCCACEKINSKTDFIKPFVPYQTGERGSARRTKQNKSKIDKQAA